MLCRSMLNVKLWALTPKPSTPKPSTQASAMLLNGRCNGAETDTVVRKMVEEPMDISYEGLSLKLRHPLS